MKLPFQRRRSRAPPQHPGFPVCGGARKICLCSVYQVTGIEATYFPFRDVVLVDYHRGGTSIYLFMVILLGHQCRSCFKVFIHLRLCASLHLLYSFSLHSSSSHLLSQSFLSPRLYPFAPYSLCTSSVLSPTFLIHVMCLIPYVPPHPISTPPVARWLRAGSPTVDRVIEL